MFPKGVAATVMPLQERPTDAQLQVVLQREARVFDSFPHVLSDPILVVSGSHLFGRLTWIQREALSGVGIRFSSTALKPVFLAEITGLQTYTPANSTIPPDSATLLLSHPYGYATKLQQDSSDVSSLSGLATFGGFWTFVNGTFALFFGANVVYFALGRRPLSALGLVHVFQRRTLARQWHADLPALRTEGGQPGSGSAGIIAFIRERLIDIDQDPQATAEKDLEAQHSASYFNHEHPTVALTKATEEYGLEDIPLVHPDLEVAEMFSRINQD
ncbi:hypothetical protein B0H14DRAFT_1243640 [Mycena olivaceomarginata]|nr:hypothetical protein B0H14DRAFT_1243640 [Mycena olivaceomarginata]